MIFTMEPPDPERERMRLLELYSGMSEEQLEELVEDWESLTEAARTALRQAVESRGKCIEFDVEPSDGAVAGSVEWTTISEFDDPMSALLAKGLLDAAGVKCVLADAQSPESAGIPPLRHGGIRLRVASEEAEAAVQILDAPVEVDPESGD